MAKSKKNKIICPTCKGNGFVRVPYQLAKEEVHANCGVCDAQGEVDPNEIDNVIVDADGIHRLQ
jgi:DnaJ-class molecular chaperone